MNLDEIKKLVFEIENIKLDDENAHFLEDYLKNKFIIFVANSNNTELSNLAKEVLKVNDIEFSRWFS